jgi:hypothetical protein
MVDAQARDGGRDERRERRGKRADPQPRAPACDGGRELRFGQREALGDRIGVLEQDLALAGEPQAARRAIEQPGAELALQQRDLRSSPTSAKFRCAARSRAPSPPIPSCPSADGGRAGRQRRRVGLR